MIKRSRRLVFFSLLLTWPKWHTRPTLPSSVFDSYSNCKPSVQSTMRLEPTQRDAISWLGQVNWYLIDLTKLTSLTWTTMLPARRPSLSAKTLKRFCVPASRTPRGIPGCINTRPARKVAPLSSDSPQVLQFVFPSHASLIFIMHKRQKKSSRCVRGQA